MSPVRRLAAALLLGLAACTTAPVSPPEGGSTGVAGEGGSDGGPTTIGPIAPDTSAPSPTGWIELAPMETARSEHPAVVHDDQIVVLGGLVEAGLGRTGVTPTVEAYKPETDTWRELPALPQARHHGMAAVVGDRLFFIGGYTPDGLPSAAVWELVDDVWRDGPPLPAHVAAGAAVSVDEHIYVVGGVPDAGLFRYDVADEQWTTLPAPGTQREHVAAVIWNGDVWAIAGRWMGEIHATTEIHDPESETWRAGPSLSEPRSGFGATVVDDRIIVAGGEVFDPDQALASVESLSDGEEQWRLIDPLPHGLHGNPLVTLGDQVFLPGGSTRPAGVANDGALYRLDSG